MARIVKMMIRISRETYEAIKKKMYKNRDQKDPDAYVRSQVEEWVGTRLDSLLGMKKIDYSSLGISHDKFKAKEEKEEHKKEYNRLYMRKESEEL